ncbi:hypothetical protein [Pseudaminobacter soli (ex Li et al. 2025)]|uniref:hypothetical protein n=1 Tax=Pseudaminobacter soli (ex Li et al. 2025) TaxID=1295366 RepID=UPI0011B1EEA7|nr:hypothetical protein [Mesorhizobium soli]
MSSIRIGVRIPRMFGLRVWIATRLFELAGLVIGWSVVVKVGGAGKDVSEDEVRRMFADAKAKRNNVA